MEKYEKKISRKIKGFKNVHRENMNKRRGQRYTKYLYVCVCVKRRQG